MLPNGHGLAGYAHDHLRLDDGSDSNSGLSANDPIQSIARADQLMTNNTRILFERRHVRHDQPQRHARNYDTSTSGYGTGASPILMYTGAKVEGRSSRQPPHQRLTVEA